MSKSRFIKSVISTAKADCPPLPFQRTAARAMTVKPRRASAPQPIRKSA